MPHADFAHLRVHTAYSLLEGAIKIKDLAKMCEDMGMPNMPSDNTVASATTLPAQERGRFTSTLVNSEKTGLTSFAHSSEIVDEFGACTYFCHVDLLKGGTSREC